MRDDPMMNLSIVNQVKQHPILFDTSLENVSKQQLEKAWELVGKETGLAWTAARDRWRIIRGSYVRYLRQYVSNKNVKEYYMSKYMEFLKPYLKTPDATRQPKRKPRDDSKADEETISSFSEFVETADNSGKGRKRLFKTLEEGIEELIQDTEEEEQTSTRIEPETSYIQAEKAEPQQQVLRYTIKSMPNESVVLEPQETAPKKSRTEEETNPDMMFFKSLLPDLNQLSKKQKNIFKVMVINAMNELLED